MRILNNKYSLKGNLKKLDKEIVEIEKEILKKTKEWFDEVSQSPQQDGAKLRKNEHRYIG